MSHGTFLYRTQVKLQTIAQQPGWFCAKVVLKQTPGRLSARPRLRLSSNPLSFGKRSRQSSHLIASWHLSTSFSRALYDFS